MKTAAGYKLVKFTGAVTAFCQGFIREFLKCFLDRTTFLALILIDGHAIPPEKRVVNKYLE